LSAKITATEPLPADYLKEIETAFKQTLKDLYNGKQPTNKMLVETGKALANRAVESYGAVQANFTTPDAVMLSKLVNNCWQFSAAKNHKELRDLSAAMVDNDGKLREWNDFKEAAQTINEKFNQTWMRTEYDQAIAGATSAARWADFEKDADTIPNLQYQTVGDSFVRPEHQILNGVTRPLKDEFWNTHYPPNGWGCRCEALQVPDGFGAVTPDEKVPRINIAPMFRTNLAKTGVIFPKEHPYFNGIKEFPEELSRALLNLPPENSYTSLVIGDSEIDIHLLHGERELGKNLNAVNALLQHDKEAKIKLLPIIQEKDKKLKKKYLSENYLKKFPDKNPDLLYNKKVAEIEVPNGSKRSIQHAVEHGIKQAEFIIIHLPEDADFDSAVRVVNGQMKHYQDNNSEIWLVNNKEKRIYKSISDKE
jgi:SPP1 gp7 family putative phage head morphogenesis protein